MKTVLVCLLFASVGFSCKRKNCYDPKLQEEFKTAICVQDCPGVIGCDDKTYCNECIANSQGIRVK